MTKRERRYLKKYPSFNIDTGKWGWANFNPKHYPYIMEVLLDAPVLENGNLIYKVKIVKDGN